MTATPQTTLMPQDGSTEFEIGERPTKSLVAEIASVSRAFWVLERISEASEGLTLNQVADGLQLNRGTAHRILSTLVELGYIERRAVGNYVVTLKLYRVAAKSFQLTDLYGIAMPILRRLAESSGELAQLAVVAVNDMVFVAKAEGPERLKVGADIGMSVVPHAMSAGLVWLASMSDEEVRRKLYQAPLHAFTSRTVTDVLETVQRVSKARERGYATIVGEYLEGVSSVGVPVCDSTGKFVAAFTLTGPSIRLTQQKVSAILPDLLKAADQLSSCWIYL